MESHTQVQCTAAAAATHAAGPTLLLSPLERLIRNVLACIARIKLASKHACMHGTAIARAHAPQHIVQLTQAHRADELHTTVICTCAQTRGYQPHPPLTAPSCEDRAQVDDPFCTITAHRALISVLKTRQPAGHSVLRRPVTIGETSMVDDRQATLCCGGQSPSALQHLWSHSIENSYIP